MESFLNRYRNITVLLLVLFAQLVLLAMQVKNDQDVRVIRVWAVTTVTPVARVVEFFRGGSIGFVKHYLLLHDATEENRQLKDEVGRLRLENNSLRNELATAERAKALQLFQASTPSKMLAANVIGTTPGSNSKVVFVSRGSAEGVMRGMAVVTPDGILGKVIAAYPTASEVMLVTDPEFAAGVVSQKNQARGTMKGQGGNNPLCKVDYIPFEQKLEVGEWFYTSGDDRIFPRGLPVGTVKEAKAGKDILVEPSALRHGMVEDVLIVVHGVHEAIPEAVAPTVQQPVYIAPPPPGQQGTEAQPGSAPAQPGATPPAGTTEADKLRTIYKSVGDAQNHNYGEGPPGSKPPDFLKLPSSPLAAPPKADTKSGPAPGAAATPAKKNPPAAGPAAPPKNPTAGTPQERPSAVPGAPPKNPTGTRPPETKPGPVPVPPAQKGGPGGLPR
jgi:rod shape-determining protein MreC